MNTRIFNIVYGETINEEEILKKLKDFIVVSISKPNIIKLQLLFAKLR